MCFFFRFLAVPGRLARGRAAAPLFWRAAAPSWRRRRRLRQRRQRRRRRRRRRRSHGLSATALPWLLGLEHVGCGTGGGRDWSGVAIVDGHPCSSCGHCCAAADGDGARRLLRGLAAFTWSVARPSSHLLPCHRMHDENVVRAGVHAALAGPFGHDVGGGRGRGGGAAVCRGGRFGGVRSTVRGDVHESVAVGGAGNGGGALSSSASV